MRSNRASAASTPVALGFAELHGEVGDHIAHFFQTPEEWREILVSFLTRGMRDGHKCVCVTSPDHPRADIEAAIAATGVGVEAAVASRQLVFGEGRATPDEMRAWLSDEIRDTTGRFPLIRWVGDMTWALKHMPSSRTLMEWESVCNVVKDAPVIYLCQYDLTQFRGDVVIDAFRTHPICIVGGVVHRNPLYMDPEAFLADLRARPEPRRSTGTD